VWPKGPSGNKCIILAEAAGRATRDPPIEDQLHLIRATHIEILAEDLFGEAAPGEWPIEDLGQGELALQDREVIAIARRPVRRREGMWETAQPFAKDGVDLGRIEGVRDPLHAASLSLERMPLSNGSNGTCRCVNWRFSHSCPFRQSLAEYGK